MVTIRNTYTVKAAASGGTPIPPGDDRFHLSECDQKSPVTHATFIYIYRQPSSTLPLESLVKNLAISLSKTLLDFYPAAGRVHYIPNGGGRVELKCNNKGALLVEAETELCLDALGDFSPSPLVSTLIPRIDYANKPIHEIPLFLAQVTKFHCGGIGLGLAVSHIVFDGTSTMHFVSEWSKYARGVKDHVHPFLDRSILNRTSTAAVEHDINYVHKDFRNPPLILGRSDNTEERGKETIVTQLKLSLKNVEELKYRANLDNKSSGGRPFTRYEVIAAHMWRCVTKARGHPTTQPTRLRIVMDFRKRLDPPLPPTYFGNAIHSVAVETTSGELLANRLGDVSSKIHESLSKAYNDEYICDALTYVATQPDVNKFKYFHILGSNKGAYFGNPNFEITSWMTLPNYGTDLGWGVEDYMGPGLIGFDGKCFLLPDHQVGGSVVVVMRLQVEHMEEFKRCFYEDI